MSTPNQRTGSRPSRLLAVATAFLVALSGLVVAPTVANAAPLGVTSATLDWGFKASWRNYANMFSGSTEFGGGASASPAPYNWGTAAAGSFDVDSGQGVFTVPGSVRWHGWHDIDITLTNLTVDFDLNAGTGSISQGASVVATFNSSGATVDEANGTVTLAGAAAIAAQGSGDIFGAAYGPGTELDPVSFSLGYEVPITVQPTSTTLSADESEVEVGTTVNLTATIDPAAAGSVEFFNGAASLGTAPVAGTTATLPVTLPQGAHSITANFASSDPAYADSSTAAPTVITVTVPASAAATTTTVNAPNPAAPVVLGTPVELSAVVEQDDNAAVKPAGTVEFFSVADGTTDRVSLGSEPVDASGLATLSTTALTAGGHVFVAVFTPADSAAFQSSEGERTANYGVIDTAAPEPYTPGASAESTSGATASWDWSEYSAGWAKTASGNATVNGQSFELAEGTVLADAGGAVISFEATLTNTAYGTVVMSIADPALHLRADGSGVWVASVNGGTDRLVVGTFSGVDAGVGENATRTVEFDYSDTTASGTWSAGRTSAWPNDFILQMPTAVRAFYYHSGDTPAQAQKPASPLTVDFEWPAVSELSLEVSPNAPVVLGDDVTLTATVIPPGAEGTVQFYGTPAVTGVEAPLGSPVAVSGGEAGLTTSALIAGGHTFRAEFVSSNGFNGSEASTTANYGVVDLTQPAVCTPAANTSETLVDVNLDWDWSAYSSGWAKSGAGNVTVDGQTFKLSRGVATVSDDCADVAFTGTLSVLIYGSFGIDLVDPVLTIDAQGNGAWSAKVGTVENGIATAPGERTVIAAIDASDYPDFSQNSVQAQIELAYSGTTAVGTWSAGRDSAWSNAFVLQVPSSIRSFFYHSGDTPAQATKPPAPLAVAWQIAALSGAVNGQAGDARVLQGQSVTFSAGQFRAGEAVSIVVNSEPVNLPAVTVGFDGIATQNWVVPTDFELGAHTVTFTAGSGASARSISVPFTVEPLSSGTDGEEEPDVCVALAVTGGGMNWEFKQSFKNYIGGPIAGGEFTGGSFSAVGGAINVQEGGIGRVDFAGEIRATGHHGELDIRFSNLSVQITGPHSGVLYGTLTSSGSGGYVAIANLSFSSVVVSGNTLTANGSAATLTGAGAAAFSGFYSAGTALDVISFSASLGAEVPCDSSTDPESLAVGGAEGDAMLAGLSLAALAMLLGAGLMRLRRREAVVQQ